MYRSETYKTGMFKTGKQIACMLVLLSMHATDALAETAIAPGQLPQAVVDNGNDGQQSIGHRTMSGQDDDPLWPAHRQTNQALIPPPPPGPYMSTAMRDHSVQRRSSGSSSDKRRNNPAHRSMPSSMPMPMYSPDRPWPDNLRPSKRSMPDSGHRYANPAVRNNPYPPLPYNKRPYTDNGYSAGPAMSPPGNWPSMNASGSRWMPSMGSGYGNPYPDARYRSRPGGYQSGGYQPNGAGTNQPVNRTSSQAQGRP